jgi:hypothetical protein
LIEPAVGEVSNLGTRLSKPISDEILQPSFGIDPWTPEPACPFLDLTW